MKKSEFLHKVTARWRYNPFWMGLMSASGKKLDHKKWIFIIGCYNSGTTLLDQILASHPQISGLPDEGVMLTNQLVRPEDFKWQRMWSECEKEINLSSRNQKKNAKIVKKHWSHFYDLNKEFLLEKSISNTTRIDFFNREFQPACFIHIVRNGYAVAEGIQRKATPLEGNQFENEQYPIEMCAKQWVRSLQVVEEQKPNLKNFIEIKYEELAENPQQTISSILQKLDLEKFPENYFNSTFAVHEKRSNIKNMNASSFKRLKDVDYKKINNEAQLYFNKYGYETRQ